MKNKFQKSKIVFIGYRATGKSTLAAALAERLRFDWVDTDALIEERYGAPISKIFAKKGEAYFRDLEAEVVADVLHAPQPLVIATGGGAPMRESTRELLKELGVVVWLTASVETIAQRMSKDATTSTRRPSLTKAKSPIDEIAQVLHKREPLYQDAATFTVNTDGKTQDELIEEIAEAVFDVFM